MLFSSDCLLPSLQIQNTCYLTQALDLILFSIERPHTRTHKCMHADSHRQTDTLTETQRHTQTHTKGVVFQTHSLSYTAWCVLCFRRRRSFRPRCAPCRMNSSRLRRTWSVQKGRCLLCSRPTTD